MHRRRRLKVGLGAATLLALGGGLAGLYEPGLRSGRLGVAAGVVVANLAHDFLDGVPPAEPGAQRFAVDAFLERVNRLMEALPVGSGAGARITAELLARVGLLIAIVGEGALRSSSDFRQQEAQAYPTLYQKSASAKTRDKAITILRGDVLGGRLP